MFVKPEWVRIKKKIRWNWALLGIHGWNIHKQNSMTPQNTHSSSWSWSSSRCHLSWTMSSEISKANSHQRKPARWKLTHRIPVDLWPVSGPQFHGNGQQKVFVLLVHFYRAYSGEGAVRLCTAGQFERKFKEKHIQVWGVGSRALCLFLWRLWSYKLI